jgi:hypothetical protein
MAEDAPTIDEWAANVARPRPRRLLADHPDLREQVIRGRGLGLTWPQLSEWLHLHGVDIKPRALFDALR